MKLKNEELLESLQQTNIRLQQQNIIDDLTISIGIAAIVPKHDDSYMDLIYTSDKALYKAKSDGRNIIRTKETLERNPKLKLVI